MKMYKTVTSQKYTSEQSRVLTAFEKDKQQIERSNSPIPMTASV